MPLPMSYWSDASDRLCEWPRGAPSDVPAPQRLRRGLMRLRSECTLGEPGMGRFRFFERDEMPEALARLVGDRPLSKFIRILPNAPGLAEGLLSLGDALGAQGELDPKLKELVILRVAAICRCGYEMHQHRRSAAQAGLS